MKRGEFWVARAELYASKARPVLIIQSDKVDEYASVITCLVTSYEKSDDKLRLRVEPTTDNGLETASYLMFDKIFSFDTADLDRKIGKLDAKTMNQVDEKLKYILGL